MGNNHFVGELNEAAVLQAVRKSISVFLLQAGVRTNIFVIFFTSL